MIRVPPQLPNSVPCRLAFVGEAPGSEELQTGVPLTGPSGRVFDALLRTANIDRSECLVTNVFDEKAEDNDCTEWMKDAERVRDATARLLMEIEVCQPTVVVPLGGTALWAFKGTDAITQWRGQPTYADRICSVKLMPTYHPAHIMRQYKLFSIAAADLAKAAAEAGKGPKIIWPTRKLYVEPTLDDLDKWFPTLVLSDLLSVDIETGWGQITNIGFAPSQEEAINVPFVDLRKPNKSYWPTVAVEVEAWAFVRDVLEHPVPKLGQNFGAYDAFWLLDAMHIGVRNLRHDTRLLHHALYPELEKSLAFMASSYGSQSAWKHWGHSSQEKKDD